MLAKLVSVALTASVKATDTKSVSSFNHFHFLGGLITWVSMQPVAGVEAEACRSGVASFLTWKSKV